MFAEIQPEEVDGWLAGGARLVDVREPWEYAIARVPGTVNVPLSELPARLDEIPDNVVLVCASGARSGDLAAYLVRNGYSKVANLTTGTNGWRQAGLAVESGAQQTDAS